MAIEYHGAFQGITSDFLENKIASMLNPCGLIDWTHNPQIDPCNIEGSIEACFRLINKRLPFSAITYTVTIPKRQNFNLDNKTISEVTQDVLCAMDWQFPTVIAVQIDSRNNYIMTVLFGLVSCQGNRIWGVDPGDRNRIEEIIRNVLITYSNRIK